MKLQKDDIALIFKVDGTVSLWVAEKSKDSIAEHHAILAVTILSLLGENNKQFNTVINKKAKELVFSCCKQEKKNADNQGRKKINRKQP